MSTPRGRTPESWRPPELPQKEGPESPSLPSRLRHTPEPPELEELRRQTPPTRRREPVRGA